MRSVLLTGFEAFGATPVNPAEQVARYLDGEDANGATIVSRIVPNTYFTCIEVVKAAVAVPGSRPTSLMLQEPFAAII